MPKNVGDSDKLIAAEGFEKLPKVLQITQSGHTAWDWVRGVGAIQ